MTSLKTLTFEIDNAEIRTFSCFYYQLWKKLTYMLRFLLQILAYKEFWRDPILTQAYLYSSAFVTPPDEFYLVNNHPSFYLFVFKYCLILCLIFLQLLHFHFIFFVNIVMLEICVCHRLISYSELKWRDIKKRVMSIFQCILKQSQPLKSARNRRTLFFVPTC